MSQAFNVYLLTKEQCQSLENLLCEFKIAFKEQMEREREGYLWKTASLFPILQVLPELELLIHTLCHMTLLSTGGRRI